jgi:hypothetical protein
LSFEDLTLSLEIDAGCSSKSANRHVLLFQDYYTARRA